MANGNKIRNTKNNKKEDGKFHSNTTAFRPLVFVFFNVQIISA
ncbi:MULTISPECIES: hypothetical protein [unclassified Dehalobacter]